MKMTHTNSKFVFAFLSLMVFIFQLSCTSTKIIRSFEDPDHIDTSNPSKSIYKMHMKDGCLYILSDLTVLSADDSLIGYGDHYTANRKIIKPTKQTYSLFLNGKVGYKISLSDIALVETNNITGISGKLVSMSLVGVPTVITSVYCLVNPKACFGSCPTFYAWNGENMELMAEGFSSSILPAFEKSDIDMLYWSKCKGTNYQIKLTNEALETHVIRYANLLVFPKKEKERVFATEDGKFFKTSNLLSPLSCQGSEGDCRSLLLEMDAKERFSEADSKNLAAHEFIDLEFSASASNQLGLVIGARQTLLTTYLFYQSLAYTGNEGAYFASRIENGDKSLQKKVDRIWNLLGGIEIFVQNRLGDWIKAGEIDEMGPIASDVHLIKLPVNGSEITKIRLKMTKGLWRIDYAALTKTTEPVEPILIEPSLVMTNDSINENALCQLTESNEPFTTLPGDSHILHYSLPKSSGDYEIFLKSKGYYLEWMREEWLAEQDLKKAYLMFGMPKLYMRLVANQFKVVEPTMENTFWRSRYVKK
jgi:hypothetical protein